MSKASQLFEVLLQKKTKFEKIFGCMYKNYATNQDVLSLKQRYECLVQDKHQWLQPVNKDVGNCDDATSDKDIGDELKANECIDNNEMVNVTEIHINEGDNLAGGERIGKIEL